MAQVSSASARWSTMAVSRSTSPSGSSATLPASQALMVCPTPPTTKMCGGLDAASAGCCSTRNCPTPSWCANAPIGRPVRNAVRQARQRSAAAARERPLKLDDSNARFPEQTTTPVRLLPHHLAQEAIGPQYPGPNGSSSGQREEELARSTSRTTRCRWCSATTDPVRRHCCGTSSARCPNTQSPTTSFTGHRPAAATRRRTAVPGH